MKRLVMLGLLLATVVLPTGCIMAIKDQKMSGTHGPAGNRYLMSTLPQTNSSPPTIIKMDTITGEAWYLRFDGCPLGEWTKL
jgi:hypothetical protein